MLEASKSELQASSSIALLRSQSGQLQIRLFGLSLQQFDWNTYLGVQIEVTQNHDSLRGMYGSSVVMAKKCHTQVTLRNVGDAWRCQELLLGKLLMMFNDFETSSTYLY